MWWDAVLTTIVDEFSDLRDVSELTSVSLRLLVALLLGALLGYQRESRGAAADLRTHMLVAMGAALFVLVSLQVEMPIWDLSRVLQGIIAGVGFLGAGAILKMRSYEVSGLTTAEGIWLTAAVGVAAGLGLMATAVLSAILAWVVLALTQAGEGEDRQTRGRRVSQCARSGAGVDPRLAGVRRPLVSA